jgi:hypothetical protein
MGFQDPESAKFADPSLLVLKTKLRNFILMKTVSEKSAVEKKQTRFYLIPFLIECIGQALAALVG